MKEIQWIKTGQLYQVQNKSPKLLTHASNPLAMHLEGDLYRIFYSGRDKDNRSSICFVDCDVETRTIINDPMEPIVCPKEQTFYSHGITIGNMWTYKNNKFIGFMGWQQKSGQHWRGDIGKFNLHTGEITMLMGTSDEDKISLSYPHVMEEDGIYRIWYGSTIDWTSENGEMIHVIKHAETKDFIEWKYSGISIPFQIGKAQAFSKPSVYKDQKGYHMWFSYRSGDGTPYRIGYAYSIKGKKWHMKQSNLTVSEEGWDSEMVCYPYVFEHKGRLLILYNGNRHGLTGFGIAEEKIK
jgi:hypothetical protein